MAQYEHLPIYKQTYDILLRTMVATKDFPREYKFTLGQKIKDELIELVILIYRANSATDKKQHIESILERVQAIQLMMRLSHDMKILPRRHYAALSEMTENLAKSARMAAVSSPEGGIYQRRSLTRRKTRWMSIRPPGSRVRHRSVSGSNPAGWYWSSTQNDNNNARDQRFSDGNRNWNNKNNHSSVRLVRSWIPFPYPFFIQTV